MSLMIIGVLTLFLLDFEVMYDFVLLNNHGKF